MRARAAQAIRFRSHWIPLLIHLPNMLDFAAETLYPIFDLPHLEKENSMGRLMTRLIQAVVVNHTFSTDTGDKFEKKILCKR